MDPAQPVPSRLHLPSEQETVLDWDRLRALIRQRVRVQLYRAQPSDLDEITQRALVRVLRVLRCTQARNPEGLATWAADLAVKDWLRSNRRWHLRHTGLPSGDIQSPDRAPGAGSFGDPLERLRFVVLEYFRSREAACAELAEPFFASCDWEQVARATGRSHDAVRKQWSRCIARLRLELSADLAPLFEVFRDRA